LQVDQTVAKAIDAGIAGIAVLAIIAVLLLVLFLGAIIKIILDQNTERRERERREERREEDRRAERIQMNETYKRQTDALESLKATVEASAEREKSLIVAVGAIQQGAALTIQERTVQAETWKGLLGEIQAMRADNAADRDETHTVISTMTQRTETQVSAALSESLKEHRVTQQKIDGLPDALLDRLTPVIERLEKTIQAAKTDFLNEVADIVKNTFFDPGRTQPIDRLLAQATVITDPSKTQPVDTAGITAPFTEAIDDGGTFVSSGTIAPTGATA
jgi:uncharacterized membrane protein YhiD involved in acid resistance